MAKKKVKHSNTKIKKKQDQSLPKEVALDLPAALKALCILSFIGFIYCLVLDTGDYFAYSTVKEMKVNADQSSYEMMEERLAKYKMYDIDTSKSGLESLTRMSIYRTLFDIISMVGAGLMYFRIRKGFYIYTVSQVLYVAIPFFMFGISTFAIFDKALIILPLIYVGLFTIQLKHLNR